MNWAENNQPGNTIINKTIKHCCISDCDIGQEIVIEPTVLFDDLVLQTTCYKNSQFFVSGFQERGVKLARSLEKASTKRKAEYLAGRYCANKGLATLGVSGLDVMINHDKSPLWPEGYTGSIAHSQGIAFAATGSCQQYYSVGIDVEEVVSKKRAKTIATVVLSESERALQQSLKLPFSWFFMLVFSAKESLFKLLYPKVQHFFGFDAAIVLEINTDTQTFVIKLQKQLSSDWRAGSVFTGSYIFFQQYIVTLLYLKRKPQR